MHSGPRTKSPKEQKFNVSLTILYLTLFMWFVHTCGIRLFEIFPNIFLSLFLNWNNYFSVGPHKNVCPLFP